jgi:serine/threonine-protein kinase
VPDVTNQTAANAEALLTSAGLTPALIYQPVTDPSQDGIVLSQDPVGGQDATPNEVVSLTIGQLQTGTPGGDGGTTTAQTTTSTTPAPTPP